MRTFPGAIGVVGLLVLAGTACAGEMCKWVDEDGCVHYAASCPPGVKSEKLALPAPPTDAQRTAAAEGYESAREYLDDRDDQRSKGGDGDRVRSISTAALGLCLRTLNPGTSPRPAHISAFTSTICPIP